jgi:hypothetical protein
MKQCTICQKELPMALDEFGPVQAVLCKDCHFDFGATIETLFKDYFGWHQLHKVFKYVDAWGYSTRGQALDMLLNDLEWADEEKTDEIMEAIG